MKRLLAMVSLVGGLTSEVVASPLTEALARHSDRDVAALRGRADLASRCTLGAIHARRSELARAALLLDGCAEAELPADLAGEIAGIDRELQKKLRDSDLAMIEVVTSPAGMTASITAFPGETFTTPARIYLPEGDYEVEARHGGVILKNVVHAVKRSRGAVVLDAGGTIVGGKIVKDGSVDFADEGGGGGEQHSGPPPAVPHKNMMDEKFQKGLRPVVATAEPNPNALEDPFAIRREPVAPPRRFWLGLRIAGGMFDDGATQARAGVAVAATGRFALAGKAFFAGRLDWSRRGGQGAIDAFGASAGAGVSVVDNQAVGVAVLAQLRGDLRLAGSRTMAMTDVPVERAGLTAAAGVELSLPRTPFAIGARFEQGLTTLSPRTRDRALLLELGVDWR